MVPLKSGGACWAGVEGPCWDGTGRMGPIRLCSNESRDWLWPACASTSAVAPSIAPRIRSPGVAPPAPAATPSFREAEGGAAPAPCPAGSGFGRIASMIGRKFFPINNEQSKLLDQTLRPRGYEARSGSDHSSAGVPRVADCLTSDEGEAAWMRQQNDSIRRENVERLDWPARPARTGL
jgi:hypothetical protein